MIDCWPVLRAVALCGHILQNSVVGADGNVSRLSTNVAELEALYHGLEFIAQCPAHTRCTLLRDSQYAANVSRQIWCPRAHVPLVRSVAQAATHAASVHALTWCCLGGHRDNLGNVWADRLARMGAGGLCRDMLVVHRGAPATGDPEDH